jgi:hypothetical protein
MAKKNISGGSYQGPVVGPNSPKIGKSSPKANGNSEQTIATAQAAYKKVSSRKN